jgi:hypothetical protein
MAHGPEVKQAVRAAYIFDRLTVEQAAERAEVGVATARRWKTQATALGDDWDKARGAHALSREGAGTVARLVLADFLTVHQSTVDGLREEQGISPLAKAEALSRLSDAFTKTMNAVSKASPEMARFSVANELLRDLGSFVREEYPDHVDLMLDILGSFSAYVARKYG